MTALLAGSGTAMRWKRGAAFAAVSAVLVFGGAWVITLAMPGPEVGRAVWTSAWLALGVQLMAFAIAQPFLAKNPLAGWGLGSVLRLLVLVLYALVGLNLFALSATPALLSLAGFLFLSMLVESFFLKP